MAPGTVRYITLTDIVACTAIDITLPDMSPQSVKQPYIEVDVTLTDMPTYILIDIVLTYSHNPI